MDLGTGYVRDVSGDKPAFHLLFPKEVPYEHQPMSRVAQLLRRGEVKYGTSEDWKEDPYMNTIEVSTHGNIRRKSDKFVYKTWINKWGYELVSLSNEKRKHYQVHRLVAETWIGLSKDLQVNHKDFNRLNNNVANLEYLSAKENVEYTNKAGRKAINISNSKITYDIAEQIRLRVSKGEKQKDLAIEFGVSPQTVCDIMKRRVWNNRLPNSITPRIRNWESAELPEEYERFKESALRHLVQLLSNENDEDHAAAVVFNMLGIMMMEWKLNDVSKSS